MTKQVNSSKQTPHTFPESIRKKLEEYRNPINPITSANYCGDFAVKDGGVVVRVPTFVVNGTHHVYVHDATKGLFQYETITHRQECQRKFGEQVHRLMDKYGFSWNLGKVIVKAYDIESTSCLLLCESIQEAKEAISRDTPFGRSWKKEFDNDPKEATSSAIIWYGFHYMLNTHNRQVFNALKNYLFVC